MTPLGALARDLILATAGAVVFGAVLHGLTAREPHPSSIRFGAAPSSRTGADDCRAAQAKPRLCRAAFYSGARR